MRTETGCVTGRKSSNISYYSMTLLRVRVIAKFAMEMYMDNLAVIARGAVCW